MSTTGPESIRAFAHAKGPRPPLPRSPAGPALGVADSLKGQIPVGFLVLKAGVSTAPEAIKKGVVDLVREQIGPVAALKTVILVPRLPKTRSGKILRDAMRQIAGGESYKMPATIEDPAALDEIADALKSRGMGT